MQGIDRVIPIIRNKTHLRITVLFNLLVALFLQIFFMFGGIIPESIAHAVDEKPGSHEKNSPSPSPPGMLKTSPNRDEIDLVSGYAEDVFDLAKAGKWKRASKKLIILGKTEHNLTVNANILGVDNLAALAKATSDLERAVTAKSRLDAMISANKITAIAALIAKPFKQCVPTNVVLLDYYGRELEIWSEMKNANKLADIVNKMHLTWQNLMPTLIAEGGSKEIKKFGEIMKHLEMAKTPEEYGRLATSVLDEVDNLERVFTQKPSKTE
jgi:hypothetical protein